MGKTQKGMSLQRMFADVLRTLRDAFGGYHPELHYMRGPGPKWREKHGVSDRASLPWVLPPASSPELALVPIRSDRR